MISTKPGSRQRMSVAARFHKYCKHHGIDVDKKLPYGAITSFMTDHIVWTAQFKQPPRLIIRKWYAAPRRLTKVPEASARDSKLFSLENSLFPMFFIVPKSIFVQIFLGRLTPFITTTESPQILVIFCENEARGGI